MATPITWQNVQGRSLAEAATPLQYAAQNIGSAFDKLGGVYKDYQAQQQKQIDLADEANVQNLLERLQGAGSVDDVAALRASGELDSLRAALKPKDLAKVRGAEDARVTALMQQTTAKNTFDDTVAKRAAEPILEQFRLAGLNGDEATQARLLAENPNIRGWATAVEQDKALERKLVEQARADRLAPYTEANTIAESKLKGAQLKTAERANNEADEQLRLETKLAEAREAYLLQQTDRERTLGSLAQNLGYPVDSGGFARIDDMTEKQLSLLNAEANKNGLPSVENIRGSDTKIADAVLEELTRSKEFSARTLQKNREPIRSAFASNNLSSPIGNDAAAIALSRAQQKAINAERAQDNWSAPGSPDARRNYEELAKDVPALMDKTSGFDAEEDVAPIQDLLNELAVTGIEVQKGVFVTPSVNDVRAAIRSAEGGWFTDAKRAKNIKEKLIAQMNKPEVAKRLAEAKDLKEYSRKEAVRSILNSGK